MPELYKCLNCVSVSREHSHSGTLRPIRRHCERSEAIHSFSMPRDGLLRFARNDGGADFAGWVEPTGRANARPMTGSAKQSMFLRIASSLRSSQWTESDASISNEGRLRSRRSEAARPRTRFRLPCLMREEASRNQRRRRLNLFGVPPVPAVRTLARDVAHHRIQRVDNTRNSARLPR